MITICPATLRDMTWIAANMRDQDRREIKAVIDESDTAIGAMLFASSQGLAWCAFEGDEAIAAFGVSRLFNGLGSVWAYGTKRLRRAVPAITRFGLRVLRRQVLNEGFRRLEVRTAIDHDLSHRWLEGLGFIREGIAIDYGKDGIDFVTYAVTRASDRERRLATINRKRKHVLSSPVS